MQDQWKICVTACFCLIDRIDHAGDLHVIGKSPGDDLAGIQVHDAGEANKSGNGSYVCDVCTPDSIWNAPD